MKTDEKILDCPLCGSSATLYTRTIDDGCSCGMAYCRSHEAEIVECNYCSAEALLEDWQDRETGEDNEKSNTSKICNEASI